MPPSIISLFALLLPLTNLATGFPVTNGTDGIPILNTTAAFSPLTNLTTDLLLLTATNFTTGLPPLRDPTTGSFFYSPAPAPALANDRPNNPSSPEILDTDAHIENCRLHALDCDLVPKTWVAHFRLCTGAAQTESGPEPWKDGCTGTCTDHARPCPFYEADMPCFTEAPRTNCIETDGRLLFDICFHTSYGRECTPMTHVNPSSYERGNGEDGKTWVYNVPKAVAVSLIRPESFGEEEVPEGFDMDKAFLRER